MSGCSMAGVRTVCNSEYDANDYGHTSFWDLFFSVTFRMWWGCYILCVWTSMAEQAGLSVPARLNILATSRI